MSEVVSTAVNNYSEVRSIIHRLYDFMQACEERQRRGHLSPSEMVDLGFLFRQLESQFDDLRKEMARRKDFFTKVLCLINTRESLETGKRTSTMHGSLARVSLDVKLAAILPKSGTPEYSSLLAHLGIPEDAIDKRLVSLSWKGFVEHVTELAKAGKQLPPGIDLSQTIPEYKGVYTRLPDSPIEEV